MNASFRSFRKKPPFFSVPSVSSPTRNSLLSGQWAWMDLNHRPLPYQGSALTELSYRPEGPEPLAAG
jgi:hypothetical protein